MASDVKRTVEIAIKLTGLDTKTLDGLAGKFDTIAKAVQASSDSLSKLKTTIESIKVPQGLDNVVKSLKAFSEVKAPNVEKLVKGLNQLSTVKKLPNLDGFVTELEKFSKVKLPNVSQIARGLKGISDASINIGDVGSRLRILQRNLKRFSEINVPNIGALAKGLEKLGQLEIGPIAKKIQELNTAIKQLDKAGHLSSFAKFASDLNNVSKALEKAQSRTNRAKQSLDELGTSANSTGRKIRSFGDKIQTYVQYRVIADSILALKQAAELGSQAILEYDQALKDLQAITGATSLEVELMGAKIKQVASDTKFSASEVAQGMRTLGQAGFDASESIETMQAVSDLATGTLSDMSTTVDLVTTAMRVFKIDASQSALVADVFGNAVNKSKLTIDKLRTSMNFVGPVARDVGVSFQEMAAAMGLLANSGLRASTIGTGLRRVFAELADPSKKLADAARSAGVALEDLDPRTKGLATVIQNLGLVINDAGVAFNVFGKRGAAAVLALTSTEGNFKGMLKTVGESGTAAHMAAIQMEGLGVSFKNLQDKLGLLAITLGEAGIADIFRILIDVGRSLVDVLTTLAETAIGGFLIKASLMTASLYSMRVAFIALTRVAQTTVFTELAASVAKANVSFVGLKAAISGITLTGGLLVAGVLAIVGTLALLISSLDDAKEASEEASKAAAELGTLGKTFQDYAVATSTFVESSKEATEANLTFRRSLLETAKGVSAISEFANRAAHSISPLTGEIQKGSKALEEYNAELERLQFTELTKAVQLASEATIDSGKFGGRVVSAWKDIITETGIGIDKWGNVVTNALNGHITGYGAILDKGEKRFDEYRTRVDQAFDLSASLSDGEASFKQLQDFVKSIDFAPITAQEESLVESFKRLSEASSSLFEKAKQSGQIDLRDSTENFTAYAKSIGLSGIELDSFVAKAEEFKSLSAGDFDTIIEKWTKEAEDGIKPLADYIEKYKFMGLEITKSQESQIKLYTDQREMLQVQLKALEDAFNIEIKQVDDKEAAYRRYFSARNALVDQAQGIQAEASKNSVLQTIISLNALEEAHEDSQARIRAKYSGTDQLKFLVEALANADAEYVKKRSALLQQVISPEQLIKDTRILVDEVKLIYAEGYKEIQLSLLDDNISKSEAVKKRTDSERKEAEEIVALWQKAEADIVAAGQAGSNEAISAKRKVTAARIAAAKVEISIAKDKSKLVDIEKEHINDLLDVNKQYSIDIEDAAEKRSQKLETIETNLNNKITDIQRDSYEKQKAFNEKRLIDAQSLASDLDSISASTEDKIRAVRQRGKSSFEIDSENEKVAAEKIIEANKLVARAKLTNDSSALKRGQQLFSQAESLASSLRSQSTAISLLQKAETGLKKARNVEGALKSNADLIKQQEAMADNVQKIRDAENKATRDKAKVETQYASELDHIKEASNRKLQGISDAYLKATSLEDQRHIAEIGNLDSEISKYQEKLVILEKMLSVSKNLAESVSTVQNNEQRAERGFKSGGIVQKFANGGFARKRDPYINEGSPLFDSVKALLMKGEYIIKRSAVQKFGVGFFDALNAGINPIAGFATGGLVNNPSFAGAGGSDSTVNLNLNLPVPGKAISLKGSRNSINELMRQLEQMKRLGQ